MRRSVALPLVAVLAASACGLGSEDCECAEDGTTTIVLEIPTEAEVEYFGEITFHTTPTLGMTIDCRAAALEDMAALRAACAQRSFLYPGQPGLTATASLTVVGSDLRCEGEFPIEATSVVRGGCCPHSDHELRLEFTAP